MHVYPRAAPFLTIDYLSTGCKARAKQARIHAVEDPATGPVPLRSITQIITDLSKPIPERHLRTRKQGGQEIHYIEWHTAVRFLDNYAPGWSCEVRNVTISDARCVVTVRISITCPEGIISREATGTEDEELKVLVLYP
jgi:hypothetical protein